MSFITRLGLRATHTLSIRAHSHTTGILAGRHTTPGILRPCIYQEISTSRKEAAYDAEEIAKDEFRVFADGSGYRGGVGGAARAETPVWTIVMKEHLGTMNNHLPVEGEILGIILALKIIKTMPSLTRATILVDSQQAIRETVTGICRHRYLIDRFNHELRGTRDSLTSIRLAWVPGHDGIRMNELVDRDAKAAASGESATYISISPSFAGQIHISDALFFDKS